MEEISLSDIKKQKYMAKLKQRREKESQAVGKACEIRKLIHDTIMELKKENSMNLLSRIKDELSIHNVKSGDYNECDTDVYITSVYLNEASTNIQFFFRSNDIIMIVKSKDNSCSCIIQ